MQIHVDLGIPFFADHIRALPKRFDSNFDVGEPLISATWKEFVPTEG
jgi:hypothetical protein